MEAEKDFFTAEGYIKGFMKVLIDYSPKLISALVILFIGNHTLYQQFGEANHD